MNLEQSMARLEEIVNLITKGNLPLEETAKLYEEANKLAQDCEKAVYELREKYFPSEE